jgi:hypothetical protein
MQVTLDEDQHRRAKRRAATAGISLAEYIRRVVAAALDDEPPTQHTVADIFDLGRVDSSDIARHKDSYLGRATAGEPEAPAR